MQETDFDKLPPHSLEAERCLLGSMMLDADFAASTLMSLDAEAFYLKDHEYVYRGMRWLLRKGRPIDAETLREALNINKVANSATTYLEEIGGTIYLAEILNTVPSSANGSAYLKIVQNKKLRRDGIAAAHRLKQQLLHEADDDDPASVINQFAGQLVTVGAAAAGSRVRHISSFAEEFRDGIMSGENPRLMTKIYDLDQMIGGLMRGGMHVAAGRPAMGKSQFGKQIVRNIAEGGATCGIVTIEEQGRKIATNLTAGVSGIRNEDLAYRRFGPPEKSKSNQADWERFMRAVAHVGDLPIWIADEPAKLHEVEQAIHTMIVKEKCEFILVDYLQLIEAPGDSRQTMVNDISRGLKRLFKKYDVPGLVLAQLNRGTESRDGNRPKMSDLRESGAIEQDGDVIMLLHREDYYRAQRGEHDQFDRSIDVIVAKNKDGAVGDVKLTFNGDTQTISDRVPDHPF